MKICPQAPLQEQQHSSRHPASRQEVGTGVKNDNSIFVLEDCSTILLRNYQVSNYIMLAIYIMLSRNKILFIGIGASDGLMGLERAVLTAIECVRVENDNVVQVGFDKCIVCTSTTTI